MECELCEFVYVSSVNEALHSSSWPAGLCVWSVNAVLNSPSCVPQVEVLTAGQWGALAVGALGGVLAFALRALREKALVEKAEVGSVHFEGEGCLPS